jgi:hypothetical protein
VKREATVEWVTQTGKVSSEVQVEVHPQEVQTLFAQQAESCELRFATSNSLFHLLQGFHVRLDNGHVALYKKI